MVEYTSRSIEQITGMPKRKIQFLVDYGIIVPQERRRGKPTVYTEKNLIEIAMVEVFQTRGLSNTHILQLFKLLRKVEETGECPDFFANNDWGTARDLIYVAASSDPVGGGHWNLALEPVQLDYVLPKKVMDHVVLPAKGPITMIKVGVSKQEALERLGLLG